MTYKEQVDSLLAKALKFSEEIEKCTTEVASLRKLLNSDVKYRGLYDIYDDICLQIFREAQNAFYLSNEYCGYYFLKLMKDFKWNLTNADSCVLTKSISGYKCEVWFYSRGIVSVSVGKNYFIFEDWCKRSGIKFR